VINSENGPGDEGVAVRTNTVMLFTAPTMMDELPGPGSLPPCVFSVCWLRLRPCWRKRRQRSQIGVFDVNHERAIRNGTEGTTANTNNAVAIKASERRRIDRTMLIILLH
jgi:hypothetical protein